MGDRDAILDASINKYNMIDEDEDLPEWFKTDEKKHVYKSEPVTKEETANERERLKEFNARESKKVMEAKWRKKKRAASEMKKKLFTVKNLQQPVVPIQLDVSLEW